MESRLISAIKRRASKISSANSYVCGNHRSKIHVQAIVLQYTVVSKILYARILSYIFKNPAITRIELSDYEHFHVCRTLFVEKLISHIYTSVHKLLVLNKTIITIINPFATMMSRQNYIGYAIPLTRYISRRSSVPVS